MNVNPFSYLIEKLKGKVDKYGVTFDKKATNGSGALTYQLSTQTIHVFEFSNATYHILVTSAFAYKVVTKIGGADLNVSIDSGTGIVTISGAREYTNVNIRKWDV